MSDGLSGFQVLAICLLVLLFGFSMGRSSGLDDGKDIIRKEATTFGYGKYVPGKDENGNDVMKFVWSKPAEEKK